MITILFGAGASYGSGNCKPTNPPLGDKLFEELILIEGAFSKLDIDTKQEFKTNGFESGMATIANDSRIINPLQKELAKYFSKFVICPDNAYARLFNRLKNVINKINIATLNYDLLIEQSLYHHQIKHDYNGTENGVAVLKLHGSSNFLPNLNGLELTGSVFLGTNTFISGLETKFANSHQEVIDWCNDPKNNDISPVMAKYEKGKRVVINSDLIKSIQQTYDCLIKSSKMIVLIGVKYIEDDFHIWNPILQSGAGLLVVDPYPENTIDWIKKNSLQDYSVIKKGFEESVWEITKQIRKAFQVKNAT